MGQQLIAVFFRPHLQEMFVATRPARVVDTCGRFVPGLERPVELQLVDVKPFPPIKDQQSDDSPDSRQERFSLLFVGPHQNPLIGAIYTVSHRALGSFEMFLNPVQANFRLPPEQHLQGRFYESCFA